MSKTTPVLAATQTSKLFHEYSIEFGISARYKNRIDTFVSKIHKTKERKPARNCKWQSTILRKVTSLCFIKIQNKLKSKSHEFVSPTISLRAIIFAGFAPILAACSGGNVGDPGLPTAPPPMVFQVGGMVSGLETGRSFELANLDVMNQALQRATVSENGAFSLRIPSGSYNISIVNQPSGQNCIVVNATGVADADVTNISIKCAENMFSLRGNVIGLSNGESVTLVRPGISGQPAEELRLTKNGAFQFRSRISGPYNVAVAVQPLGKACSIRNNRGRAVRDINSVVVDCSAYNFTIGGNLIGSGGHEVLLRNNTSDELSLQADGTFVFPTPIVTGSSYNITAQIGHYNCTVANAMGVALATVTNAVVDCTEGAHQLDISEPPITSSPPVLNVSYGIKTLNFSWSGSVPAPTNYKLYEDPDGPGPLPRVQLGDALTGTTYTHVIPGLLHTRYNAQYFVQSCAAVACMSNVVTPNLTEAVGYFKASNADLEDLFGQSIIAVSADGSTVAVSATLEDSVASGINGDQSDNSVSNAGAVYIFIREGAVWSQQAYIKASNTGPDQFGVSLALSADGNTLAVGAWGERSDATGINGNQTNTNAYSSGAAYVYTRNGTSWSQEAYIKASNTSAFAHFGFRIALSGEGNTLAVSAFEDGGSTGINGNQQTGLISGSGAVYIFTRTNAVWSQQAYIKASNTGLVDRFGADVALSFNGNTLAVGADEESGGAVGVNANQNDNSAPKAGAVYVFTRSGIVWSQQAYIKASNAGTNHYFGGSLALAGDGQTLAIGASGESGIATGVNGVETPGSSISGAAYVFVRNGTTWNQQAYIKASNNRSPLKFGWRVSITGDGDTLAVSALDESSNAIGINDNQSNTSAPGAGAVYLFRRSAGTWSQQAYFKAPNTDANDGFGYGVAISADGSTLAVGAVTEASNATGIGGDQTNNSAPQTGALYIY